MRSNWQPFLKFPGHAQHCQSTLYAARAVSNEIKHVWDSMGRKPTYNLWKYNSG